MTPHERVSIEWIRNDLETWISFDGGTSRLEISPGRHDIITLLAIVDRDYPADDTCKMSRQELIAEVERLKRRSREVERIDRQELHPLWEP